jgi:S-adenosylmethionine hydrolase
MADSIITLTTDFGDDSPYVAAMKGVILALNPAARLVDLSHQIPPQDVTHSAFFLPACVPLFPAGTIHVIVIDPGVGTDRALLYVEIGGQRLLVPDNGCWTTLIGDQAPIVIRLEEQRFWRQPVSHTFHGRDILAPVAGHLSLGADPHLLGPAVSEWVRWEEPRPSVKPNELVGEVVFVDHFGNLISNIPGDAFRALATRPVRISIGGQEVRRRVDSYAQAKPGELVALISSSGRLEIAVVNGNAARHVQAKVGTPIQVVVT